MPVAPRISLTSNDLVSGQCVILGGDRVRTRYGNRVMLAYDGVVIGRAIVLGCVTDQLARLIAQHGVNHYCPILPYVEKFYEDSLPDHHFTAIYLERLVAVKWARRDPSFY